MQVDESKLKPMILKDVAKDIDMHESTVSRITSNKYIDTPQGIFELKYFFHSGITSYMGDNMSSVRVKKIIQEIISTEDEKKPLTDDQMVQALMLKYYDYLVQPSVLQRTFRSIRFYKRKRIFK